MSFIDTIKKSVISEFSGTLSISGIIISLLVAFAISIFIIYVYKKTYTGVIYSRSFALCLILLSLVTSIIIRTINSNLALSLGMVGALSIVRFRTAVKEPVDTAFLFWGIAAGIMAGAGLYIVSIMASLTLGVLYILIYSFGIRPNNKYLLIVKFDINYIDEVNSVLNKLDNKKLKSKSIFDKTGELTYELTLKNENTKIIDHLSNTNGVINSSLISYQNDFGE